MRVRVSGECILLGLVTFSLLAAWLESPSLSPSPSLSLSLVAADA